MLDSLLHDFRRHRLVARLVWSRGIRESAVMHLQISHYKAICFTAFIKLLMSKREYVAGASYVIHTVNTSYLFFKSYVKISFVYLSLYLFYFLLLFILSHSLRVFLGVVDSLPNDVHLRLQQRVLLQQILHVHEVRADVVGGRTEQPGA